MTLVNLDHLLNGRYSQKLVSTINEKELEEKAKTTLLDHLIENRNLKHSLSWYVTKNQALKFCEIMENSENQKIELELVDKIFQNHPFERENETRWYIYDIGCGNGDKLFRIASFFNIDMKFYASRITYFLVDGSPYFNFITTDKIKPYINRVFSADKFMDSLVPFNESQLDVLDNSINLVEKLRDRLDLVDRDVRLNKISYEFKDKSKGTKMEELLERLMKEYYEKEDLLSEDFNLFLKTYGELGPGPLEKARTLGFDNAALRLEKKDTLRYFDKDGFSATYELCVRRVCNELITELGTLRNYGFFLEDFKVFQDFEKRLNELYGFSQKENLDSEDILNIFSKFNLFSLDFLEKYCFGGFSKLYIDTLIEEDDYFDHLYFFTGDIMNLDFINKLGCVSNLDNRLASSLLRGKLEDEEVIYEDEWGEQSKFFHLFLGQTLGNFDALERKKIVSNLYSLAREGDQLMIGVELRPSETSEDYVAECDEIAKKYADGNIFIDETVKLLGANDENLVFYSTYNFETNSVDMEYLVLDDVIFTDGEREVKFAKGEIIPVASSYKFSPGKLDDEGNYGKTELEEFCESVGFTIVGEPAIHNNKQGNPDYMVLLVEK